LRRDDVRWRNHAAMQYPDVLHASSSTMTRLDRRMAPLLRRRPAAWLRRAMFCSLLTACRSEAATVGGECIAPANPGGGWDLTCRAAAEALATVGPASSRMRVANMPGNGGGIAYAHVAEEMRGNEGVIVAASPSTLLGIAQNHYGRLTERDVRWLAAVGAEKSVVAVSNDAPWHTLKELMAAWRADPQAITIGGSSAIGGGDHMKVLLLARAAGMDVQRVRYLPLDGAPEAIRLLRAGSIQVYPADVSKILRQAERKEVRVIAVLGDSRASGVLANVPTAREQGFDVIFPIWRGLYAPPGISDSAYRGWVRRLDAMRQSPEWKAMMARNGLTPFYKSGAEFEQFVTEQTASYRAVSREIGLTPRLAQGAGAP
jgi:putative tricarboxylic transport membrane protein